MHAVAFCVISEPMRLYADNYDEISTKAADRKFGHDVFEECAAEATKNWGHPAPKNKDLE
jgi:hypothetical protein